MDQRSNSVQRKDNQMRLYLKSNDGTEYCINLARPLEQYHLDRTQDLSLVAGRIIDVIGYATEDDAERADRSSHDD
jgi:hypothetical protein